MAHEATVDGVDPDEDAHEDEAYAALDQMLASQREALREALGVLLRGGPDALLAAEDTIRHRLSDEGALALSQVVEQLFPDHEGVYWALDHER